MKINYIAIFRTVLTLALFSIGAAGCNNQLDVQPTQSIDESVALSTSGDVEGALIGCYDGATSGSLLGGGFQYEADFLADDGEIFLWSTFSTVQEIWKKAINTTNGQVLSTWAAGYNVINRTNSVLGNLNKLTSDDTFTASQKRRFVEGEARFLRATMYFNLIRLFAKPWSDGDPSTNPGIPLTTTATKAPVTDVYSIPRSTVAQVYQQIITDLTQAESLLQDGRFTDDKRIAEGASAPGAAAILSRVYLSQGNYAAARDAANRVIQSGEFALEADFEKVFNDYENRKGLPSSESIFSGLVTLQDGSNELVTYYAASFYGGRGDVDVQRKHLLLYEDSDLRGTFFYNVSNGRIHTSKYIDQYANVTVIRLAEMYLTRAEGNFRLRTQVGATPLADINVIRNRAGVKSLTDFTLDAVLKERKLELMFEGELLHDLKRTRRNIKASNPVTPYNADNVVFPIPQRERDVNKNLTQNPGYF